METELDAAVYPLPLPIRRLGWVHLKRRIFTPRQCDELARFAETKGRYHHSRISRRDVEICYLSPADAPWAFETIAHTFATENIWGFALSAIVERMRIQRYRRGGYTSPHMDYDYQTSDQSKITAIVPLVEKTAWAGGDLFVAGVKAPKQPGQGDCLLFPSFAWHGLSRVTRGARIVLSGWVAGPRLV